MELVAYLHGEMLCERLQHGESIDQVLDCQLLEAIAKSSHHAKSVACVGLAAGMIAINTTPIAAFAYSPDVANVQQLLAKRGFNPGAIDGVKGTATKEAIIAAQTFYKLTADGVAGAQTIAALENDGYSDATQTIPTSPNSSSSEAVKNVQQLLSARGFYSGAIDGVKGPATTEAIIAAQTFYKLTADGVAGAQTIAALSGDGYVGSNASSPAISILPTSSDAVKNLQQLLSDRGFYGGAIDGIKGPMTQEAVILAQKTYGLIPDGVAGSLTIAALEADKAVGSNVGNNVVAISYKEKASSTTATVDNDLKKVQALLSELSFYDGAIDGVQGSKTTEAIKKAQTFYSLPVTGVLDAQTLAALKS